MCRATRAINIPPFKQPPRDRGAAIPYSGKARSMASLLDTCHAPSRPWNYSAMLW